MKLKSSVRLFSVVLPASSILLAPQLAAAQTSNNALEEVIVTAERREATTMTTSISMVVLQEESLKQNNVKSVAELGTVLPGLTVQREGFLSSTPTIRGIGTGVAGPSSTMGVAVLTDGLYAAEANGQLGNFFDVATVELLRGPQGTFVGQSAIGGAVRINSRNPNFDGVNGYAELGLGNYNQHKLTGAINFPVSETLAARVAFNTEQIDSFYRNLGGYKGVDFKSGNNPGNGDFRSVRVGLLWRPNDAFEALLKLEWNRTLFDGSPQQPNPRTYVNPGDPNSPVYRSQYASYDDPNPWVITRDFSTSDIEQNNRFSLNLSYKLDNGIALRSLTGVQQNESRDIGDRDATNARTGPFYQETGPNNNSYSQEFNVLSPETDRLSWIGGVSWFMRRTPEKLTIPFYADVPGCGFNVATASEVPGACLAPLGDPTGIYLYDNPFKEETTAIFGQAKYKITDTWEIVAGARNSWDRRINIDQNTDGFAINTFGPAPTTCQPSIAKVITEGFGISSNGWICAPPGNTTVLTYKNNTPTWKVNMNWTPAPGQLFYAFWARGYKAGGVNNLTLTFFKQESVDDYELGWKGTLLDGRMQIELGGFYMNYKDLQENFLTVNEVDATNGIQNIPKAKIQGIEASLRGKFGNLGVNFNANYTDSSLGGNLAILDSAFLPLSAQRTGSTQYLPQCASGVPDTTNVCFNYGKYGTTLGSGVQKDRSPKLSYTLTFDYGFNFDNATLRPRLTLLHTDKQYNDLLHENQDFWTMPAHDLVNASLSYERKDWTVQLFCTNCADKTYISSVSNETTTAVLYGAPFQLGLSINRSF